MNLCKKLFSIFIITWLMGCLLTYLAARYSFLVGLPLLVPLWFVLRGRKFTLKIKGGQVFLLIPPGIIAVSLIYGLLDGQITEFGLLDFTLTVGKAVVMAAAGLSIFLSAAAGFGLKFLRLLKIRVNSVLEEFLLALGPGLIIFMNLGLLLAWLGLLKLVPVAVVLLIGIFISWRRLVGLVKELADVEIEVSDRGTATLLVLLFILFLSHTAVNLRGFPVEYDSLTIYANTVKNLAEQGRLPPQWQFPFGYELILAQVRVLFGPSAETAANSIFGLLSVLATFLIARRFTSFRLSVLAAAAVSVNPAVTQLLCYDNKVDLGLLFFSLLSVYAFLEWSARQYSVRAGLTNFSLLWKNQLSSSIRAKFTGHSIKHEMNLTGFSSDRSRSPADLEGPVATKGLFLILSALFAGTAFTIKYTTLFLIIGLGAALLVKLFSRGIFRWAQVKILLLVGFFILLPFVPWAVLNLYHTPPADLGSLMSAALYNQVIPAECSTEIINSCYKAGRDFDIQQYFNPQSLWAHFVRPFRHLAGKNKTGLVGRGVFDPLILGLLPLVFFIFDRAYNRGRPSMPRSAPYRRVTISNQFPVIIFVSLAAWYLIRPEVLWYILPTQCLLLIFLISSLLYLDTKTRQVLVRIITGAILAIGSYLLINNITYFITPGETMGEKTRQKVFLDFNDFVAASDFVNKLELSDTSKALLVNQRAGLSSVPEYFINNNWETMEDCRRCQLIFLDAASENGVEQIKHTLENLKVTYLLVEKVPVEQGPQGLTWAVVNTPLPECILENRKEIEEFLRREAPPLLFENETYAVYSIEKSLDTAP